MSSPSKVPSYEEDVDFDALALQDADFAKLLNECKGKIDFHNAAAVQQLTKSLLKRDFNIQLELPGDRLCPPVPVRYNYIRWIQELIDTTSDCFTDEYDLSRRFVGLDIGVGSSCIYPLLGCSSRHNWLFAGTEIDDKNFQYAKRNVQLNNLSDRVRLHKTTNNDPLLPLDALGIQRLDFTMCNPPFYASKEDMLASYSNKSKPPPAVCTGADVEMITGGGDAGFVLRIVQESLRLRDKVQWYSSMLGKLESVNTVVAKLKEVGMTNWAVTCLRAGNKTRRWAVAWSFGDRRPRNDVARRDMTNKEILPFPTEFTIPFKSSKEGVAKCIDETLTCLPLHWEFHSGALEGIGSTKENVWSRAARRRQQQQREKGSSSGAEAQARAEDVMDEGDDDDHERAERVALLFKISVKDVNVNVRWLRGQDTVIWESFCGMLKRAVDSANTSA